ncbi:MAG: hypothetical protein BroJett003_00390 [Planctomycetota bacterium]|nr:MAG: hypothetical protein BroJett003_00390 [Planctomycetota bacterium]
MNTIRNVTGIFALLLLGAGCASSQTFAEFGDPLQDADEKPVAATEILAHPDAYADRTVLVSGRVENVCRMKGCWMTLAGRNADEKLMIRFTCPIEGRLIPVEAVGRKAVVRGQILVEEISQPQARHIAEDAGKSAEEVEKIVGPQKQIRVASPSARIFGLDPTKN